VAHEIFNTAEAVKKDGGMLGAENCKLDQKSRISIPAKFRRILGTAFYLTISDRHCLEGYTEDAWRKLTDDIDEIDPDDGLILRANSAECAIDSQGRTLIPPQFRTWLRLEPDTELCAVGNGSIFQLWIADEWNEFNKQNATMTGMAEMKRKVRQHRASKKS
jgi:MraZ protein